MLVVEFLLVFAACFLKNGTKAFQNENVIARKWRLIFPTSFALQGWDYLWFGAVMATFVSYGWWGPVVGWLFGSIGSGLGSMVSMWLHDRMEAR